MTTEVQLFEPGQCMCGGMEDVGCVCMREERALRAITAGQHRPMTPAEREWCRHEIAAVEGYTSADAEGDDKDVAHTVLRAWTDYCRDKGML